MIGVSAAIGSLMIMISISQFKIMLQLRKELASVEACKALQVLGPLIDKEKEIIINKREKWSFKKSFGMQYLKLIENNEEYPNLHYNRRILSNIYESICFYIKEGGITLSKVLRLMPNLKDRVFWFTVIEDIIGLQITSKSFDKSERLKLVEEWNKSRETTDLQDIDMRIELGKSSMREVFKIKIMLTEDNKSKIWENPYTMSISVDDVFKHLKPRK